MPRARKREPIVPAKVKQAFEHFLSTPNATLQSAAALVGLQPRWLRFQLQRPECLRWMLAEKQARLEIASAGNIPALVAVRDREDGNEMAKVHATKVLEQMLDVTSQRTGIGRQVEGKRMPGLQIVILPAVGTSGPEQVVCGPPKPAPLIEATPQPAALHSPADPDDHT
jgi:hypothetical protein